MSSGSYPPPLPLVLFRGLTRRPFCFLALSGWFPEVRVATLLIGRFPFFGSLVLPLRFFGHWDPRPPTMLALRRRVLLQSTASPPFLVSARFLLDTYFLTLFPEFLVAVRLTNVFGLLKAAVFAALALSRSALRRPPWRRVPLFFTLFPSHPTRRNRLFPRKSGFSPHRDSSPTPNVDGSLNAFYSHALFRSPVVFLVPASFHIERKPPPH